MRLHQNAELERRRQLRIEAQIAARQEAALRSALRKSYNAAAEAYIRTQQIDSVVIESTKETRNALVRLWTGVIEVMGERVGRQIQDATGKSWKPEKKQNAEPFINAAEKFILEWGARKVTQLSNTTANFIRGIILSGIEEGKTLDEIGRLIRQLGVRDSVYRAHLIARTEVHSASQYASLEAATESQVCEKKIWIPVNDDRTRGNDNSDYDHVNVDPADLSQPFIVSGEPLMFPGDPAGSPGNIIMCRCAMTYEV